ncbi:hypothetical protein [Salegentibacter chungangensis]|uniref:Secretion system C-terminal sorting domain-containing protein n=1 Tax=Salegentibacter chungangensis TaxID=1335724 RepID=A0ABW3NPR4_9FLAO
MKKVSRTLILVLLLVTSFNIYAAKDWDVKVSEEQHLVVELDSNLTGAVVSLQDLKGNILYKEVLSNDRFSKQFDFELLPEGTYYLKLDKKEGVLRTEVKKSAYGITVSDKTDIVFKPVFKVEGDLVKVFLHNNRNVKTSMEVTDAYGEVVGVSSDRRQVFKRTLDFSEVPAGEYTVSFMVGEEIFSKKLYID